MIPSLEYDIEKISEIVGGKLVKNYLQSGMILNLLTDSRKINAPEVSLFFAIKGKRNDGHAYIRDLYKRGLRNFVISTITDAVLSLEANFIIVDDTLDALQKLAAYHRKQFSLPVVGITGSNGKTIVKEWLYQLMRLDKHIVRSPRSYNSQTGVPLSVWQIKSDNSLALFEAGISQPDEMKKLEAIIKPNIVIFTNIGQAHEENFDTSESSLHKVLEKLSLVAHSELLIYCKDYKQIQDALVSGEIKNRNLRLFTWSKKQKADMQIGRILRHPDETEIQCIYQQEFHTIKIPFTDDASIENAIHCWAFMICMGYEHDVIASRMEVLSPVAMRLEMKEGVNNCSIINDTYNSDIGSLTIALDFLLQQKQHENRVLILSDILQSGKDEQALYAEVSELIAQKKIDHLIGIGEAISRQQDLFETDKKFYKNTEEFLKDFNSSAFRDQTILLKGARAFSFERISKLLQKKAHETVLEINLNAIVHNLNYYRSKLQPETKVMAMVKAFSYGSGSFEIANVLQFHRTDYLAVAYADEGIELRKSGIQIPIMVMNPEEQSFESMITFDLEPEIYSFRLLNQLNDVLNHNLKDQDIHTFPIHIKLDTGMHRLGFQEEDINELIVRIRNNKSIQIQSVFSHLAASGEAEHDAFTLKQISSFKKMSDKIISHFNYPVMRHILNSAGINRFPDAQFDMVRLGLGLYGISSDENEQKNLQGTGILKSTISQIKNIAANDTIGYSRKGVAKKDMTIATIAIGYADGFNRRLGNGKGKIIVNGKMAPVVGNVCMDMCMIDITDISAKEGDEVIIFGPEYSILQIAKDMGTIPYEILTNISQRVKRVYFHE